MNDATAPTTAPIAASTTASNPASGDLLRDLRIASPCKADWSAMTGDEKKRFCGACKLHVHDLSAMTRDEAQELLRGAGPGRVCVRFHRRADGTVLTQDCPVGLRRRLRRAWTRAAAMFVGLWTAVSCTRPAPGGSVGDPVMGRKAATVEPTPTPTMGTPAPVVPDPKGPRVMGEVEMGDFVSPRVVDPQPQSGAPTQGGGDRR